jgi:hypothetical protein
VNAVVKQDQLPGMPEPSTILDVISRAASDPTVDIDKMQRLMEMYERVQAKNAETAFNDAMTEAQKKMRTVVAREENSQTHSKYASYSDLDKAIRPIYTEHGFSISFDTADSPKAEHVRVLAYVARGGHTRTYKVDMPADGKGAKGGDVMTKTHAAGAAMSYGSRYLLKMIFNVSVGEDDTDGNEPPAERISATQVADLAALMTEVKADRVKFLAYLKVKSLEEIPVASYKTVVGLLEAKRRQA